MKKNSKKYIYIPILLIIIGALSFLLDKTFVNLAQTYQSSFLSTFFYLFTMLGETYIFLILSLFWTIALFIEKKKYLTFIITVFVAALTQFIIKIVVNRQRPFEDLGLLPQISTISSSFPSGHSMMFFATVPLMSKSFPKVKYFFWALAILVALSRVYFNVHYFSDIVCGAIIGYFIGYIALKIFEKYKW